MNDCPLIPAPTTASLSAYPQGCWPLTSHLRLPAVRGTVPAARHYAREQLASWSVEDTEAAELVTTELVTNAVGASMGKIPGMVRLWLCCGIDGTVLIMVWDCAEQLPVRQEPGPATLGGRGLVIVEALSKDWGVYRPAAASGKVVWALIAAESS